MARETLVHRWSEVGLHRLGLGPLWAVVALVALDHRDGGHLQPLGRPTHPALEVGAHRLSGGE